MRIGLLHTTIRGDEKLLIAAARELGVELEIVDVRKEVFNPATYEARFDVALERCVSTVKGMAAIRFFEGLGIPVVNNFKVASLCEDKFATSLALRNTQVPTPRVALVFSEKEAREAIKDLDGYPVVLKPLTGSWGRLIARINDEDALEAVLEHKEILGSPTQKAFYLQEHVAKPERDIRVTVVGNKVVCAIYRESPHWITNTARGAEARPCEVSKGLAKISLDASKAVGGGVLGIDIFETGDGYLVNEVNHTTEFKNVQRVTGVDVAGEIINYCRQVAKGKT